MTKRGMLNWAIWIGVLAGIYCGIYASIPVLLSTGLMWTTFVALPIFFAMGAKRSDYFPSVFSLLAGVFWGVVTVWTVGLVGNQGVPIAVNLALTVGLITIVVCAIHLIPLGKTWLNRIPMIFGGWCITFVQGGQHLPIIIITMIAGITAGLACMEGTNLMNQDGTWKFFKRDNQQEANKQM